MVLPTASMAASIDLGDMAALARGWRLQADHRTLVAKVPCFQRRLSPREQELFNTRAASWHEEQIAIIGGGPAGLMAGEVLSLSGHQVTVYDSMPTVARKFLLAGKSGLNITHSEDYARFANRFGPASERLRPALDAFTPNDIRAWAAGLGTETFTGSSGRVFPEVMKASPLLRAWLGRLEAQGVKVLTRHRWSGFAEGGFAFKTPGGRTIIRCDAALLALGGASYPRLRFGSPVGITWLRDGGVDISDFQPCSIVDSMSLGAQFSRSVSPACR